MANVENLLPGASCPPRPIGSGRAILYYANYGSMDFPGACPGNGKERVESA
jgi:hypothetical protein